MEIGAFEAKDKFGMLLDRVECGEEIIITRHGKPVARLVPNTIRIDKLQARAVLERIRARAGNLKETFDWAAVTARGKSSCFRTRSGGPEKAPQTRKSS